MREKNYNIELIRTISFVAVVVIHVTNYFCRAYGIISVGEYGFALILDTFSRVSVPCFFMITGALLLGREETLKKNGKRILHFLTALIFWSLIYYAHNVYYMKTDVDLMALLYKPAEPHLWYLYATVPIYFVLPFFQVMCKGMNTTLVKAFLLLGVVDVTLMYVLSFLGEELYYDVPVFGDRVYAYYIFLGYFIYQYKDKMPIRNRTLFGMFIGSNVLNILMTAGISYRAADHYERLLEYGCPLVIISSASFFLLMLRLKAGNVRLKPLTKKIVDQWCACSFGIYLIHILLLDNYKKYIAAEAMSAWIAIPALVLLLLAASFGCVFLIRKIPGGKKIT